MKVLAGIVIFITLVLIIRPEDPYPEKHPHFKTPYNYPILRYIFPHARRCGHPIQRIKSNLKSLGQYTAMYYTDGVKTQFPVNPNDFEIDIIILRLRHLNGTEKALPENWQIPNNWHDFNQSKSPFAFVRSFKENYTGDPLKPLFIIKPGYQPHLHCRMTVFEDGHVKCISKEEAIKLWIKAGVWNE
ncbi:MAG: hypothetical protein MK132_21625 [Lentisphaerales bacterium]|nr:hypothetical protein [Lentisphaerales bacterium]